MLQGYLFYFEHKKFNPLKLKNAFNGIQKNHVRNIILQTKNDKTVSKKGGEEFQIDTTQRKNIELFNNIVFGNKALFLT